MENKRMRTVREHTATASLGKHCPNIWGPQALWSSSWCRDAFCNLLFSSTEHSGDLLHSAYLLGKEAESFLLIAGHIPSGQRHKNMVLGP